ncbi:MAG: TetR/AcrR family transcriptional regulator [Persicimonas sp.]
MSTKRLPAKERKKQILHSAIRVFARSTYHGATTKSISEEAGVTEALIYRYFGSKRALFTEAVHNTSERLVQGLEEALERNPDNPVKAITQCFQYYVQMLEKHEDFAKMIFLVLSELDQKDIRETYLPYQERALKAIAAAIDRWKDQGLVPGFIDTKTASWLFFGTYLILALVKQTTGGIPMDPSYAIQLARAFVKGD